MTQENQVEQFKPNFQKELVGLFENYFSQSIHAKAIIGFVGPKTNDEIFSLRSLFEKKTLPLRAVQIQRFHSLNQSLGEYPSYKVDHTKYPRLATNFLKRNNVTDIVLRNQPFPDSRDSLKLFDVMSEYVKETKGNLLITIMEGDNTPFLEEKLINLGAQVYRIPEQEFLDEEVVYVISGGIVLTQK